jgi:hypothetical protein
MGKIRTTYTKEIKLKAINLYQMEINGIFINSSIPACLHVALVINTHSIHPLLFLQVV